MTETGATLSAMDIPLPLLEKLRSPDLFEAIVPIVPDQGDINTEPMTKDETSTSPLAEGKTAQPLSDPSIAEASTHSPANLDNAHNRDATLIPGSSSSSMPQTPQPLPGVQGGGGTRVFPVDMSLHMTCKEAAIMKGLTGSTDATWPQLLVLRVRLQKLKHKNPAKSSATVEAERAYALWVSVGKMAERKRKLAGSSAGPKKVLAQPGEAADDKHLQQRPPGNLSKL